jgi:hypothetical protein
LYIKSLLHQFGNTCGCTAGGLPCIHDIIDSLIHEIAQRIDPEMAFTPVLSGSVGEGTKVIQPNEADYLCVLKAYISDACETPASYSHDRACVELKISKSKIILNRRKLFHQFYFALGKVLQIHDLWEKYPMLYRLTSKDIASGHQNISCLELMYHDDTFPWMRITVDLVPAIAFPNWQPPWSTQHPLQQGLLNKHGCHAVAKWIPEAHNNPCLFQLGFVLCEIGRAHV